jgi:hypothetical protein
MSGIITQNVLGNSGLIKAVEVAGGTWVEIKSLTASSSTDMGFVNGASDVVLDSTYPVYCFRFINLHPSNNDVVFQTNFSIDTGSNYNVTKTTTNFEATHTEADATGFKYGTGDDIAQGTGSQRTGLVGSDNDESLCGELWLFAPSSTTFVKQFFARTHGYYAGATSWSNFMAGYCNTTSAVDAVNFDCSAGNIDTGKIKLFGIKDS